MKKLFTSLLILAFMTAFTLPAFAAGTNIASNATWTASSEYSEQYAASFVVTDTVEWDNEEWASAGEQNPSIIADFSDEVWINKIVLYDRPNPNDWSADGIITFSDGSTIDYTNLDNEGEPLELNFEPKNIKSFTIQISGADTSSNNGFAKIEVYDCDAPVSVEPVQEDIAPVEEIPAETEPTPPPTTEAVFEITQAPATGDFSTTILFFVLLLSAAGIGLTLYKKRTNK